ncbi:MAG: DNA recombination protein RmuC [Propionibacteriaceae bacterium]|nr:DNA recombination protein RmuC [Propionibacteriaceae bacterium]
MELLPVLLALLALALGAVLGYLFGRRGTDTAAESDAAARDLERRQLMQARDDSAQARADASRAREEAALAKAEIAQVLADKAELRAVAADAQRMVAEAQGETAKVQALVAATAAERDAAVQKAAEQAVDREVLLDRFKVLSAESLEKQGKAADVVADQRMKATEQLVAPLAEGLRQMQEKLQLVEKDRVRMAAELSEQVNTVRQSGEAIRRETLSLSNALRTPQVRGAWGESSLKRIVEISGLTERCDFDTQQTYSSDDGLFRPDLRINLPAGKVIFVDAKVPLAAVLEAYNTEDEALQKAHFATFAKHVRTHIDQLAGKNYWQLDLGSPEFVVLYLPSDEFYRLAMEHLPDLHEYATRKHVVLASPGLLIPQLQIVANGWKQVALAETAGQISKLGRELYERLATLGQHFDKLGRSLGSAVTNYNRAVGALESRVMVSARRFRDLEVTSDDLAELSGVEDTPRQVTVTEMLDYSELREQENSLFSAEPSLLDPPVRQLPRRTDAG